MKHTQIFLALALCALPLVAHAQPDPNNAPKGNNPVNRAVGGGGGRAMMQNMTPEQRKTLIQTALKRQLERANVTSDAQQTAVADYVIGEAESRQKLADATLALQTGLRNTEMTDAQIAGLLNDYNAAVADDKARHQKALDTLKVAIDVTQFPRLEAMLTLAGLYGDGPAPTGNLGAMLGGGGGMRGNRGLNAAGAGIAAGAGAGAAPADAGNLAGRGNLLGRRNRNAPF